MRRDVRTAVHRIRRTRLAKEFGLSLQMYSSHDGDGVLMRMKEIA